MKHIKFNVIFAFVLLSSASMVSGQNNERFSPYVDSSGNISSPVDYRATMVHMGSWFVPDGEASGFHDVYTEKETVDAFRKTGKFPDGATLVKELRASEASDYSTGQGVHRSTAIKQWFVMVKDTENRFNSNPLWGDGWGWALFKPTADKTIADTKNVAADYKKDCLGCHVLAKDNDWVYTEAYPTLLKE